MHQLLPSPANVFAFSLSGTITEDDIHKIFEPLEAKLATGERFGLVADLSGFEDMTAGAIKEDLKSTAKSPCERRSRF